jgi:hypothetical protein
LEVSKKTLKNFEKVSGIAVDETVINRSWMSKHLIHWGFAKVLTSAKPVLA